MQRLYESLMKACMADFPAVAILGPRQCGKTTLGNFVADFKCRLGLVIDNDEHPRFYTERILGIPFACL